MNSEMMPGRCLVATARHLRPPRAFNSGGRSRRFVRKGLAAERNHPAVVAPARGYRCLALGGLPQNVVAA